MNSYLTSIRVSTKLGQLQVADAQHVGIEHHVVGLEAHARLNREMNAVAREGRIGAGLAATLTRAAGEIEPELPSLEQDDGWVNGIGPASNDALDFNVFVHPGLRVVGDGDDHAIAHRLRPGTCSRAIQPAHP